MGNKIIDEYTNSLMRETDALRNVKNTLTAVDKRLIDAIADEVFKRVLNEMKKWK